MAVEQINRIDDMTLDLVCSSREQAATIEGALYDFARHDLIEAIDTTLKEIVPEDEDYIIENLEIDLGSIPSQNPLDHIRKALSQAIANKVKIQILENKCTPVAKILQDSCSRGLPLQKSATIESDIRKRITEWCEQHAGEKFDPLQVAETVLRQLHAQNPGLDIRQIACNTFEKLKNLGKKDIAAPKAKLEHAGDCGIVLLAPYIPMLFEKTGCTQAGQFSDNKQRALAVSVLSYTIYGRYTPPPADNSVIELLCGFDTSSPLTEMPILSSEQKNIAESLLNGVITNWSAIGHTSPDGLRSSFLIRDGILTNEDNGPHLKITPMAFDILLDKLPWSYTTVKLPWQKTPLHVTWRER